jgi:arsenate reductase
MASDKFEVFSAGVKPTQVNPFAIKVMAEVGIDISSYRSKSVMEFLDERFDYIITLCDNAKQTCPMFPSQYEKIHWDVEDPADVKGSEEERLYFFRKIRNEIKNRCLSFMNKY